MAGDAPACPRGHADSKVVRDGVQSKGGRKRQRWRCTPSNEKYHRFLGVMSRARTHDATCIECEVHLAPHQGPVAPSTFEYLVREIAGALVDVGSGATYKDAAKKARARANIDKVSPARDVSNGQTVVDWMTDFVPVVAARYAEKEWPAVLVLDSTTFFWTDPLTKNSLSLFTLFAAYGYDRNGNKGRLWKVGASPDDDGPAWAEFLASLPGKPVSIVCDQSKPIIAGINQRWGEWAAVNLVHHCEHHLDTQAKAQFKSDNLAPDDPIRLLFRGALQDIERWDTFVAEVLRRGRPAMKLTYKWVEKNATLLRGQIIGRPQIPPVYSNSGVEQEIRELKAELRPRRFAFRNRARLNQLLDLMRLKSMNVDHPTDYAKDIRTYIEASDGRPERTYREAYDSLPDELFSSLWSVPAQLAMREARLMRAEKKAIALSQSKAHETDPHLT